MLILDSFPNPQSYKSQLYANPTHNLSQKSPNFCPSKDSFESLAMTQNPSKITENNPLMDWFLQTLFIPHSSLNPTITNQTKALKDSEISANLLTSALSNKRNPLSSNLQITHFDDEKTLQEIAKLALGYYRDWHEDLADRESQIYQGFANTIEARFKSKVHCKITQQEAEESQKFIFEQMDAMVQNLYQENPEIFLTFGNPQTNNPKNLNNEKLSILLCEYGARVESQLLENQFATYLAGIPMKIKDSAQNGQIETEILRQIEERINLYRIHKMKTCGYGFFAYTLENLPQETQERITEAITQVLLFYAQPNIMEVSNYKISWNPYESICDSYLTIDTLFSPANRAEIGIAFQILIVFPTKF